MSAVGLGVNAVNPSPPVDVGGQRGNGARDLAEELGLRLFAAEQERDAAVAGAEEAAALLSALAEGVGASLRAAEEEANQQVGEARGCKVGVGCMV